MCLTDPEGRQLFIIDIRFNHYTAYALAVGSVGKTLQSELKYFGCQGSNQVIAHALTSSHVPYR